MLQIDFSDPDVSLFADDLLIEAAKSGNFSKVGAPAACCNEQPGLAPGLVCPLG